MKTEISFGSALEAETVLESVKPDHRDSFKRSRSKMQCKGKKITVFVEAADPTALRASFNSIMKGIVVSGNVLNAFGKENP